MTAETRKLHSSNDDSPDGIGVGSRAKVSS